MKVAYQYEVPRGEAIRHLTKKARLLAGLKHLHAVPNCVANRADDEISPAI
ncbi:MAG: hypothetical protein WKF77_22970 [Planctomycetaceae bacterium]